MSASSVLSTDDACVIEEVEALKSIFVRELEVINCENTNIPKCISINLHPATADNTQEQYVCLTLVINLPPKYPNDVPEITIRNPRGLSDEDIESITKDLMAKANENKGNAMLYELTEIVKEHLTMDNTPRCSCVICLYGFDDEDDFTRTECYHYFHSHCLSRYIKYVANQEPVPSHPLADDPSAATETKVLCPVCREPIAYDLSLLQASPPVQSEKAMPFTPDDNLLQIRGRMTELFIKQKAQGGIIDVEAEKNKYLLEISSVPSDVEVSLDPTARPKRLGNGVDTSKGNRPPNRKDKSQKNSTASTQSESAVDNQKTFPRDKESHYVKLSHQKRRPNNYQWSDDKKSQEGNRGGNGHYGGRQRDGSRPDFDQKVGMQGGVQSYRDRTGGRRTAPVMNRYNEGSSYSDCGDVKAKNDIGGDGGQNNPHHKEMNRSRDCSTDEEGKRRSKPDIANFQNRYNYPRRHYPQTNTKKSDDNLIRNGGAGRRPEEVVSSDKTEIKPEEADQTEEEISNTTQEHVKNHHSVGRYKTTHDSHRSGQQGGGTRQGPGPHPTKRPNFKKQNNQSTHGRWNGRSSDVSGSEAVGGRIPDDEAKHESSGKSSDDPPVSHLMVLTGPPTKAFTNAVGNGHNPGRLHDNGLPGSSKANLGPPPGFDLPDASVFGSVSLPPGFKPRSQPQIPMPPPGFRSIE